MCFHSRAEEDYDECVSGVSILSKPPTTYKKQALKCSHKISQLQLLSQIYPPAKGLEGSQDKSLCIFTTECVRQVGRLEKHPPPPDSHNNS